jgi:uncharacterized membrane protein
MFTKTDIERYFNAEKGESWVFMAIGIIGIIVAVIFFFFIKTNFYKGAAIPLVLVGLLLGIVGFNVYKRSDDDRIKNVYAYGMAPGELKEKELPRMETVMKNFIIYRYTEIVLVLIGIGLFFYFKNNIDKEFWKGFGAALTIMALLALSADYFAEKRGRVYIDGIKSFVSTPH